MPKHAEKPLFDRLEQQLDEAAARQLTPAMQPVRVYPAAGPADDTHTSRPREAPCCPVSRADEAGRGRWLVAARVPPGRADLRALPRPRTHTLAQRAAWLHSAKGGLKLIIGQMLNLGLHYTITHTYNAGQCTHIYLESSNTPTALRRPRHGSGPSTPGPGSAWASPRERPPRSLAPALVPKEY